MPAEVDIILPAYNAEATLLVAVTSVLSQTNGNLRVIVIDDGSTDCTADIVRDVARTDARVHLEQKENGGIVSALNAGLALCSAEYVARMDADDICEPDRFEKQIACLRKAPDIVALSGAHTEIDGQGVPTGRVHRPPQEATVDFLWAPAQEPKLTHPFLFVRRASLEQVAGYRAFHNAEDADLYWRLAELGRLANLPDVIGKYRMHAASISSASIRNGRTMAVFSQLAALSAQRRAGGKPDLSFDHAQATAWRASESLEAMTGSALADLNLTDEEARWLRLAVAAKLMELAGYRPYEVTHEDCCFMAEAFAAPVTLPDGNLRELAKMRAATAARLLRLGRMGEAMRLAGPVLWPEVAARAAMGRLYWKKHMA